MKVLKFGGKSLNNGKPLANAIGIIKDEYAQGDIVVVVSARGNSTDLLLSMYEQASKGNNFEMILEEFIKLQDAATWGLAMDDLFAELTDVLTSLKKLKVSSKKIADKVVSFGELLSAKLISHILIKEGLNAEFVDARNLIKVKTGLVENEVDCLLSETLTKAYFKSVRPRQVPVITGFIASDENNDTVTLGRNGSNHTTSLVANYIDAEEVQNWTNVSGVYTASPKYVPHAQLIERLSFKEAHELANFGASILHPKTINPLMAKGIPLKIFNSIEKDAVGTVVADHSNGKGIKAVSVIEDVALISLESTDIAGKIGIDGRIFSALGSYDISVRLISQASSEQGIGFVVDAESAAKAKKVLEQEFARELEAETISNITVNENMAIIAIVGRHNYALEKAIHGLRKNKIWMHLISNSISGAHISLVIDNSKIKKAVNVVHNQVFGAIKTMNLFVFGKGTVGGTLIDQILATDPALAKQRNLIINVVGVADSQRYTIDADGLEQDWRQRLAKSNEKADLATIFAALAAAELENIVIADCTSSQELSDAYPEIINKGFDLVAANKKANSGPMAAYKALRKQLKRQGRQFYYETNVGAGLPVITTLRQYVLAADKVTRIRGVLSGSLSYMFNTYSLLDKPFADILLHAREQGFTEPDPREDLDGLDVARKLIILARELGLEVELADVKVESLIPPALAEEKDFTAFISKKEELNTYFAGIKAGLKEGEVLRYVGDLDVKKKQLQVSLVKAPQDSPLGGLKNADAILEIYTEDYGEQPVVIQGAGAGAAVTARGVYGDLLRIGEKL